jgi:hypothetical protein
MRHKAPIIAALYWDRAGWGSGQPMLSTVDGRMSNVECRKGGEWSPTDRAPKGPASSGKAIAILALTPGAEIGPSGDHPSTRSDLERRMAVTD